MGGSFLNCSHFEKALSTICSLRSLFQWFMHTRSESESSDEFLSDATIDGPLLAQKLALQTYGMVMCVHNLEQSQQHSTDPGAQHQKSVASPLLFLGCEAGWSDGLRRASDPAAQHQRVAANPLLCLGCEAGWGEGLNRDTGHWGRTSCRKMSRSTERRMVECW